MTTKVKVSLGINKDDGVDAVVTYLANQKQASYIHVYSGVHGDGSGLLQVDEPDFSKKDEQELAQDDDELTVAIRRMTVEDGAKSIPCCRWDMSTILEQTPKRLNQLLRRRGVV